MRLDRGRVAHQITEAARLNMGLVWAAIAVSALSRSLLYALLGWIERRATFWHPSFRPMR